MSAQRPSPRQHPLPPSGVRCAGKRWPRTPRPAT